MTEQLFSWVITFAGLAGFWLAGKKIWWAWYVNIANQALWVIFAVITGYYAFLVGTLFYTIVFVKNAIQWTKDHLEEKQFNEQWPRPVFHNAKFDKEDIHGPMEPRLLDLIRYAEYDAEATQHMYDADLWRKANVQDPNLRKLDAAMQADLEDEFKLGVFWRRGQFFSARRNGKTAAMKSLDQHYEDVRNIIDPLEEPK